MNSVLSSSTTDFQPRGCIICGNPDIGWGALCHDHLGLGAWAVWVDEGLISDWDPHLGPGLCGCVEALNHRTMLTQPLLLSTTSTTSTTSTNDRTNVEKDDGEHATGWLDQLAVIVRRFGYWLGFDGQGRGDGDHSIPDDPWPGLPM